MIAIEHINTLVSSPWVMWLMFALLLLFVAANIYQPKIMRTAWVMSFKRTDRVYNDSAMVSTDSLALRLFCLATAALSWDVFFYDGGVFPFTRYILIMGCVFVWYLVRWGIRELLSVMLKLKRYGFPKGFMISLSLILCTALYGLNLGAVLTNGNYVWRMAMIVIVVFWLVVLFVKHLMFFVHNWKSLLLFLAYWLVVEVGSLFSLFLLVRIV